MPDPSDITQMLLRWSGGDREALDRLVSMVYEELKRLAHVRIRQECSDHTLNTTTLVHEAFLKMVDLDRVQWKGRAHFFALASRVMRNLLGNYAHRRNERERGGELQRVELEKERLLPTTEIERFLELDEALTRLEAQHPRPAKAIEHGYFAELTNEETAMVQGISRATVERDLRLGRAWLVRSLGRAY